MFVCFDCDCMFAWFQDHTYRVICMYACIFVCPFSCSIQILDCTCIYACISVCMYQDACVVCMYINIYISVY